MIKREREREERAADRLAELEQPTVSTDIKLVLVGLCLAALFLIWWMA